MMKKFIQKALLSFFVLGTGTTFVSCDGDVLGTIAEIIKQVITNSSERKTTFEYSGTLTAQLLISDGKGGFTTAGDAVSFEGTQCPVTERRFTRTTSNSMSDGSTQLVGQKEMHLADIELPALPVNGAEMTNVNLYSLDCKIDTAQIRSISFGDETSGTGSLTIGEQSYELSNVFFDGQFDQKMYKIKTTSLYFGETYVVNITYDAKNKMIED